MSDDWLMNGVKAAPAIEWSFEAEAPLVSLAYARESGNTAIVDAEGVLRLLDRTGSVQSKFAGPRSLHQLAWCDAGTSGAALIGNDVLVRLDRTFQTVWTVRLPDAALSVAVDPYGRYVAVGLVNCDNILFDEHKRRVAEFKSVRPLRFLSLLSSKPSLIGAAEHGLLARFDLKGEADWSNPIWNNVGSMAVTHDAGWIALACFNQGVQVYDSKGEHQGGLMLDGTPAMSSCSYQKHRLFVVTMEQKLFLVNREGELLSGVPLPETPRAIAASPLGESVIVGLESGRVMKLSYLAT